MSEKIPALLFLVRCRHKPQVVIVCTEQYLAHWVNRIAEMGDDPQIMSVTPKQLSQMILPNHTLN